MLNRLDWLVITASNRGQGRGYLAELRDRAAHARRADLVGCTLVVPDPHSRRVGSGVATLLALQRIATRLLRAGRHANTLEHLFTGQRIAIVHCGGDSRRLPAYAAQGKIFTPLPRAPDLDSPPTLFDLILDDLLAIPLPDEGRVVVATGDVYLGVGSLPLHFRRPGLVGVAWPSTPDRASRHGVYIADQSDRITGFLHKPTPDEARRAGAMTPDHRALVDTGLLSLDPPAVARWLALAGVALTPRRAAALPSPLARDASIAPGLLRDSITTGSPALDLYADILFSAARRRHAAGIDWRADAPFHASRVERCEFLHIGSTRELLDEVTAEPDPLARRARAHLSGDLPPRVVVHNSILRDDASWGAARVVVDACDLAEPLHAEGDNLIVGWPGGARARLVLPRGLGVACLPVDADRWAALVFHEHDDCKTPSHAGGTFAGRPLADLPRLLGLDPERIWPGIDARARTLWNAHLWPLAPEHAIPELVGWVLRAEPPPPSWHDSPRLDLGALMTRVSHRRLARHRHEVLRAARVADLPRRARADRWFCAARAASDLRDAGEASPLVDACARAVVASPDPLERARLARLASVVVAAHPGAIDAWRAHTDTHPERATFDAVAHAVRRDVDTPRTPPRAAIAPGQMVVATAPVRLDLAGGWSDTPPICQELGGTVLNTAITLNARQPLQAVVQVLPEPVVRITSVDLARSVVLRETRDASPTDDPADWCALPKAALVLAGVCPTDPADPLGDWLARVGGGIDLTLFSSLPKGSGLGTSSILGAAVLAALARALGEAPDHARLIRRTSSLEQLMRTGGGWQDQVGGIVPGLKIIRTTPGLQQSPVVEPLEPPRAALEALSERLLLCFTGRQRLAANILQNVVARYLARDDAAVRIIHRLKAGAERMREELLAGDVDAFARSLTDYWELKKALDPGSTTPEIERYLAEIHHDLAGFAMPGAGGGGFLLLIARDATTASRLADRLQRHPLTERARLYDATIDRDGLRVTVM